ncbi:MAG: hypothetical protein HC868_13915 [Sphingomonadales bacterium]|nr:hypothetical protein [Sphingomonadales bacterium]
MLTQAIAPGLIATVIVAELASLLLSDGAALATRYNQFVAGIFVPLTVLLIGLCGWTVFLWDIDRLFFKLESRIDAQIGELAAKAGEGQTDHTLIGRARSSLNRTLAALRASAVRLIEQAYWDDINAGGVLAFPQPDIAAAIDHIDRNRRDLLASLSQSIAQALPIGGVPASLVSRLIFRYAAPEVKTRLYRRLVLRFLSQLGALFALAAVCFYVSLLSWSRVDPGVFHPPAPSPAAVLFYEIDLILRGALFDFMEHTHRSISPIAIDQGRTAFVYYTLMFRMFVAIYVISSLFRVAASLCGAGARS